MSRQATRVELSLETMIPDLLARYPQVRSVLDRYGLRGCGGPMGPRESLRFFSQTHGVDGRTLLDELRHAISQSISHYRRRTEAPLHVTRSLADAIYRPYFLGGIAVILTLGAVWGAWLLWRIGIAGDFHSVTVHEVNAHGHAQIFGWVGLFIMGFALQALPRMWHVELPQPRLAMAAFIVMVLGILVRSVGMAAAGASWSVPAAMMGGAVEIVAIIVFIAILLVAFRRRQVPTEPYMAFILAALGWFVLQAVFGLWHTWTTMTASSSEELVWYVSTYQAVLRDMQIHGLALFMIVGVCIRMLPAIFSVPRTSDRRAWIGFGLLTAAAMGEIVIFLAYRWTGRHALAGLLMLPWMMLTVGVAVVALPWKLWRPLPTRDRSAKFVQVAYGWLAISLVMLMLLPVYQIISGIPFSHAYYGAIRHAITVGFISMMIMGFAAKVVPTLTGRDPRQLTALWGPFILVNLGCFLRVSTQTLTDWHPAFFSVVGVSGTLEVVGLAIWGVHLARLMLTHAEEDDAQPVEPPPAQIDLDHSVGAILAWHPRTLEVFDAFGFTMLRNATMRRMLAPRVTLKQAAAMRGVDANALRDALNDMIDLQHDRSVPPAQERATS